MNDDEIINLFFERNEKALTEIEKKYGQRLLSTARNILRDERDAEECVNDAYLKAWDSIPPNRPSFLSAYLAKITRNLSINKWKNKQTQKRGGGAIPLLLDEISETVCDDNESLPEKTLERKELAKAISDFLRGLQSRERSAFVLRYFNGESVKEVAEACKTSENAMKSLLFRLRKRLKIFLETEGQL